MSLHNPTAGLSRSQARRLIARALLLSLLPTLILIGLYSWLPLDAFAHEPIWVSLVVGAALLLGVGFWEVRAILRATYPGIRAVQALTTIVPLFLLLFAALYYVLSTNTPETFNLHPLTRVDTLYFTITVFGTVGFGDIAATSETGRLLVSLQIILDLLLIGFGLRVFIDAAKVARGRRPAEDEPAAPDA
jgi:voltage-gated potassium channel